MPAPEMRMSVMRLRVHCTQPLARQYSARTSTLRPIDARRSVRPAVASAGGRTSTPEAVMTDSPSVRIAAELRGRIARGELRPGERVPSAREITRSFGVAVATASRVLAALREDGLVHVVPGVGTLVSAPDGPASAGPPARPAP